MNLGRVYAESGLDKNGMEIAVARRKKNIILRPDYNYCRAILYADHGPVH